ncbi:uncharacterized protein (DUF885 family) [Oxalobacteraceae bacterium GrIS 1.11]
MSRLGLSLALYLLSSTALAAPAPWVARSDALAQPVLEDNARYSPESASELGQEKYDTAVTDLQPRAYERELADLEKRVIALRATRAGETDPKVRQDVTILIDSRTRNIDGMRLRHQYLLDCPDAAELVYGGLRGLLDPRNKPARQASALLRLRRYAGTEAGYTPIADLARARAAEQLARPGLIGPYVDEVKEELENTEIYLKGIAELFEKSKLSGWESDFAVLSKQVRAYRDWTRANVLPRARQEVRLPPAIYAQALKDVGVDISPEELIERSSFDFQETRDQMQVLAAGIAAKRGLPSNDYREVIRALKKEQLAPQELMPHYRARLKEIEAIIQRENLLTLPARAANIRIATEAEAANVPAPFMSPPRMIGNTGEYGEFVIPLANPHAKSNAVMDDFNYAAMSWTLTAHEARPGHELQFASMVEQGISIARARFAFNSANVEGWGLYSEALLLPYMPAEGQLLSLQARLQRMARAFLDPMVNLGRVTPAAAKQFLMHEVVLSEPFAQSEVDRYAYKMPGQATAYYYGYVQLRSMKTQVELMLGERFKLKPFNDFIIEQGLLPPALLKQALLEQFLPSQQGGTQ